MAKKGKKKEKRRFGSVVPRVSASDLEPPLWPEDKGAKRQSVVTSLGRVETKSGVWWDGSTGNMVFSEKKYEK